MADELCIRCVAQVDKNSITIGGAKQFHCIVMSEFLYALSGNRLGTPTRLPYDTGN